MVLFCLHGLFACLASSGVAPQKVARRIAGKASDEFASSLCNARQLHAELVLLRQFQWKHIQSEVAEEHFHLGVDIALLLDKGVGALAEAKLVEIMLHREPEFLESVRLDLASPSAKTPFKEHCWNRLQAVRKAVSSGFHFSSTAKAVHDKFVALSHLPGDQLAAGNLAERDVDDMIVDKLQEIAWPFMYGVIEHDRHSAETKLTARQFLRVVDSLPRKSLASRQFMTMVFSTWLRRAEFGVMREKLQKSRREQQLDVVAAVFRTWSHTSSACASDKRLKRAKKGLLMSCPQAVLKFSFKAWQAATEVSAFQTGKSICTHTSMANVFEQVASSTDAGDSDKAASDGVAEPDHDDVGWPGFTEVRSMEQHPSKQQKPADFVPELDRDAVGLPAFAEVRLMEQQPLKQQKPTDFVAKPDRDDVGLPGFTKVRPMEQQPSKQQKPAVPPILHGTPGRRLLTYGPGATGQPASRSVEVSVRAAKKQVPLARA